MKTINKILIGIIVVLVAAAAAIGILFFIPSGSSRETSAVEETNSARERRVSSDASGTGGEESSDENLSGESSFDDENMDVDDQSETEKELPKIQDESEVFSVGTYNGTIIRGKYVYLRAGNEVCVFDRQSKEKVLELDGEISYQMLATDDGLYYGDGDQIYYYSMDTQKQILCVSDVPNPCMVGIVDTKLYFTYNPNEEWEEVVLGAYDIASGSLKKFSDLPGVCGHSAFVIGRDRLFYLEGAGDVSTVILYEIDLDTGTVMMLDSSVASGLIAFGDYLYFTHAYPEGDYTRAYLTLYRHNLLDDGQSTVATGSYNETGVFSGISAVTDDYIYMVLYGNDNCTLKRISQKDFSQEVLAEAVSLNFINEWGDGFYYEANSSYDTEGSKVYYYSNATGKSKEVCAVDDVVQYVDDSRVYAVSYASDQSEIVVTDF